MAKKPTLHAYSDRAAFERLLLLIAVIAHQPGVGCPTDGQERSEHHNALEALKRALVQMAQEVGIAIPDYSLSTLRQDIAMLRQYGILGSRMYRWGYYLGSGAITRSELQLALQAIASQAQYQGDPHAKQVYRVLKKRLRGLDLELQGQLFYPVRTHLNRAIVHTDPEAMMQQGQYRHTLFHQLAAVERAIVQGQGIEIYQRRNPYGTAQVGALQIYPLQLIYSDIAWYLLYEQIQTGHLVIERVDRFSEELKPIEDQERSIESQRDSLDQAHLLLENGWGLYLGSLDEQRQEQNQQSKDVQICVRFFPPATAFILEGEQRHPRQKIRKGAKGAYVDYLIELPPRSLDEFCRWVYRFMHCAQILAPTDLAERQRQLALQLVERFQSAKG